MPKPLRLYAALVALVAWAGLSVQLYVLLDNMPQNGMTVMECITRFLLFFTVLMNLLVALSLTIVLISPRSSAGKFFSKDAVVTAIAVYILVVGITYNLILRFTWNPTGLHRVADEILHVAVPLLYLIYWFVRGARQPIPYRHSYTWWLIIPGAYLLYALFRGHNEGFYPYPFIDLEKIGTRQVLINAIALLVCFILLGLLLSYIHNRRLQKTA